MNPTLSMLMLSIISTTAANAFGRTLSPSSLHYWENSSEAPSINPSHPPCLTIPLTLDSSSTDSTSIPTASAKITPITYHVDVGAAGKLIFRPQNVKASLWDIVEFNFLSLNHTLTQSTLYQPCTNNSGFDTGFNQFNPKNISGKYLVQYKIETLDPQWFFCAQTMKKSHCEAGMVFNINANTTLGNDPAVTTARTESTDIGVGQLTITRSAESSPPSCSILTCTSSASSSTWVDASTISVAGEATLSSTVPTYILQTTLTSGVATSSLIAGLSSNQTMIQNSTALQASPTISKGGVLEISVMAAIFSVILIEVARIFIC